MTSRSAVHTKSFLAVALCATMLSAPAFAGDGSSDWTHFPLEGGRCDMARKPGTNVVGVAMVKTDFSTMDAWIEYSEYDETGLLHSEVLTLVDCDIAHKDLALAYTSDGTPAVSWLRSHGGRAQGEGIVEVWYVLRGTTAECVAIYDGWGFYLCNAEGLGYSGGGGNEFLELGFDQRSDDHEDQAHIVFGGTYEYGDESACVLGERTVHSMIFTVYAPGPNPHDFGGRNTLRENHSVSTAPYRPAGSLAVSAISAPQLVFGDVAAGGLSYAVFDGGWTIVDESLLAGDYPSLALDTATGEPRIAYSPVGGGVNFMEMSGGVWQTPSSVPDISGSSEPSLSIESGIMKMAVHEPLRGPVYAYQFENGLWSRMTPNGRVNYSLGVGLPMKLLVNPGSAADPWVLTHFDDGMGLAKYGEVVGGCGSSPISRGESALDSAASALVPLLAALCVAGVWFVVRRKNAAE